jgi:Protein of unknown function (DUF3106)
MARHNEHEAGSHYGKVARGVFCVLLGILPVACVPAHARPFAQGHAPQSSHTAVPPGRPQGNGNQQPHLGNWLASHGDLPPEDQERALQSEPGFSHLPPETQQRLLGRLQQLNRMPPRQRQRTIDQIEAMERLSPQMRQQVKSSVFAFRSMPPDRQRMMRKAFRDLREYPPEQRLAMMNSGQFQAEFSPHERNILGDMLSVEPYRPANGAVMPYGPQYGH